MLERVIHDLRLKPEQIAEYTKLLDEDPKGLEFVYKFDVDYEKTIRPALKKRGAEEIGGQKRYTFNYEMIFMAGFRKAWGDYTRAMEKISKMP